MSSRRRAEELFFESAVKKVVNGATETAIKLRAAARPLCASIAAICNHQSAIDRFDFRARNGTAIDLQLIGGIDFVVVTNRTFRKRAHRASVCNYSRVVCQTSLKDKSRKEGKWGSCKYIYF